MLFRQRGSLRSRCPCWPVIWLEAARGFTSNQLTGFLEDRTTEAAEQRTWGERRETVSKKVKIGREKYVLTNPYFTMEGWEGPRQWKTERRASWSQRTKKALHFHCLIEQHRMLGKDQQPTSRVGIGSNLIIRYYINICLLIQYVVGFLSDITIFFFTAD